MGEFGRPGNLGILSSVQDLPKTEALGVELRATAARAARISVLDGSLKGEQYKVKHVLNGDVAKNASIVCNSISELISHFKFKGVVGVSITKQVAELCGFNAESFSCMEEGANELLEERLKGKVAYVHAMIHTTAAGYSQLVWGPWSDEGVWQGKAVLVCTLGKYLGAVLINNGHRVRHREWLRNCAVPSSGADAAEDGDDGDGELAREGAKFCSPEIGSSEWDEWLSLIDTELADIIDSVSVLDRVLVSPTGRAAKDFAAAVGAAWPRLVKTRRIAAEKGCQVDLLNYQREAVASGAALCSLVELGTTRMLRSLKRVLNREDALQLLSEEELELVFEKFDTNADGVLELSELQDGLEQLGIQRSLTENLDKVSVDAAGIVTLESFKSWWLANVRGARVVTLTSAAAWRKLLQLPPPEGYGDLILVEVTFTFCRTCRRFEPKFRSLAEKYQDVRFVQLVGNGTIGAMELSTRELGVKLSPAFFIFRRGGEMLASWTGAKVELFEEKLAECRPVQAFA